MNEVVESLESTPAGDPAIPWIETREGMLFFANSLLIAPQFVVFFPLLMKWVVEPIGAPQSLVQTLMTIPMLAAFALPFLGWLFAVPAWFAWKTRRESSIPLVRHLLAAFTVLHLSFVLYAGWFWLTGQVFPAT